MKIPLIAAAACLLFLVAGLVRADAPGLHPCIHIYDGGSPLDIGGESAPAVIDWNNDGKMDLLLGGYGGYVWLFLNQGTDLDPVFNGSTKIESDGVPIRVEPFYG
jgi:hypothetical protein